MRAWRSPLVVVGAGLLCLVAAVAALAPVLSPYDPRELSGAPLEAPSGRHLVGTNNLGQDIASQLVWGARASLFAAVGTATLAMALAVAVGAGAALVGGRVDRAATRVIDMYLAIPVLPLLVTVAAAAQPTLTSRVVIMALLFWPFQARVQRAQARTLRQRGFVAAAKGFGFGPLHVLGRHILPGLGPLAVAGFVHIAGLAVLLEAGLSLLGVGDPSAVSWGMVINRALTYPGLYLTSAWTWWVLPAGAAVTLVVLAFAFVGVGLEPAMNRRLARR